MTSLRSTSLILRVQLDFWAECQLGLSRHNVYFGATVSVSGRVGHLFGMMHAYTALLDVVRSGINPIRRLHGFKALYETRNNPPSGFRSKGTDSVRNFDTFTTYSDTQYDSESIRHIVPNSGWPAARFFTPHSILYPA